MREGERERERERERDEHKMAIMTSTKPVYLEPPPTYVTRGHALVYNNIMGVTIFIAVYYFSLYFHNVYTITHTHTHMITGIHRSTRQHHTNAHTNISPSQH